MEDGQVLHTSPYAAQIDRFADSLKELSRVFSKIDEKKTHFTEEEIAGMFQKIKEDVCKKCENRSLCWEEGFDQTCQMGYEILAAVDQYGNDLNTETKRKLQQNCIRAPRFLKGILELFHEARQNLIWNNKIVQNREGCAIQLDLFAEILRRTSREIEDSQIVDVRVEKKIINVLKKAGIRVLSVRLLLNSRGKYEIHVTARAVTDSLVTLKMIAKAISNVIGRTVVVDGAASQVLGKEYKNIVCKEETDFYILYGVAHAGKDGNRISGDNFMVVDLAGGRQCIALSDGMGAGQKACRESALVIELLEELLEAGFPEKLAIQMINTTLVLGREEIHYSTVDMCVFDLYSGNCELIKAGASSTFIKRNGRVDHIISTSLPVGVVQKLEIDTIEQELESGDFIIMMTDGILDALPVGEQELLLETIIGGTQMSNPKDMADHILRQIQNWTNKAPQDDMMILVAGIWERG
ncbi:MAG: SpoIIE family protein phosphatase [Schaedlerella sp.]|nr:SpoIIE family protein phosphatase [Schaedlerella sp.]